MFVFSYLTYLGNDVPDVLGHHLGIAAHVQMPSLQKEVFCRTDIISILQLFFRRRIECTLPIRGYCPSSYRKSL